MVRHRLDDLILDRSVGVVRVLESCVQYRSSFKFLPKRVRGLQPVIYRSKRSVSQDLPSSNAFRHELTVSEVQNCRTSILSLLGMLCHLQQCNLPSTSAKPHLQTSAMAKHKWN
jgi:hypothetical protein